MTLGGEPAVFAAYLLSAKGTPSKTVLGAAEEQTLSAHKVVLDDGRANTTAKFLGLKRTDYSSVDLPYSVFTQLGAPPRCRIKFSCSD